MNFCLFGNKLFLFIFVCCIFLSGTWKIGRCNIIKTQKNKVKLNSKVFFMYTCCVYYLDNDNVLLYQDICILYFIL